MKIYTTYEEPLKGQFFTENQLQRVYKGMVDKTEYPSYDIWFHDMLKSGVFEQTKEKIKILSGSFLLGCGVIVHGLQSDGYYNLLVQNDKETGRLFVDLEGMQYFEEDIENR